MHPEILGIHHVTAIASDPQKNRDFYTKILGLRLIKVTVNFDDPSTYHLYYGDGVGNPGTILTFFVWPGARRGIQGTRQAVATSLAIPQSSLGYWISRLIEHGVTYQGPTRRFNEQVLTVRGPDGMALELVAYPGVLTHAGWEGSTVPAEHAIRGLSGITLWEESFEETTSFLTDTLGFHLVSEEHNMFRYEMGKGGPGTRLDIRRATGFWNGKAGAGSIHHIAWCVATNEAQEQWRELLAARELQVTAVLDRKYFHSIYFSEPGGVLFEIATSQPGFTVDEPAELLGTQLQLPSWLESTREQIEHDLPALHPPSPPFYTH